MFGRSSATKFIRVPIDLREESKKYLICSFHFVILKIRKINWFLKS